MESSRQLDPAPLPTEPENPAEDSVTEPGATTDEPSEPSAGRTLWGEPLRRLIAVALALLAVAAAITGPMALRSPGISPFDEATHIDYAYQVAHGHIPQRGSVIAPVIRADMLCRGPASRDVPLKRCGERNPPAKTFVVGAQNYNFGHPPVYYAITGVLARAAGLPFSSDHFIAFARLTGILWLFAGMLVLYLALRKFRVRWELAVCGALLLALTPAVFYLDATVTNDAAAALTGSLALLVLARVVVDNKLGWVAPAVFAFLAAGTKILNALPFLALVAVLVALAVHDWKIDKRRARRLLIIAVGMAVAVGIVYVGWAAFQSHRGDPNWVNPIAGVSTEPVRGLPFDELFGTAFSGFNLLASGYLPPHFANLWMANLQRLLGALSIGAVAIVLGMHRTWSPRFIVALTAILGVLAYPFVAQVQGWVSDGVYFHAVVSRYGITIIPFLVAAIVLAADDKRLVKSMLTLTGVGLLVGLYTVL